MNIQGFGPTFIKGCVFMVFGFLNKRKKDKTSNGLSLTIKEVVRETPEAVNLVFERPSENIEYLPGQFLTLVFTVDGKEERRSYSISSSPYLDEDLSVTIKRIVGGKVSNYILDKLKSGDKLKALKPMGSFTIICSPPKKRDLVCIGAGSGITPLYSMLKSVLVKEPESTVTLFYGNRSEEHIIFYDKLEHLKKEYGDRFRLVHALTQPGTTWVGEAGRLTGSFIKEKLVGFGLAQPEFYLCGPSGLMEEAEKALSELAVSKGKIFKESFTASTHVSPLSGAGQIQEQVVAINLYGEEHRVVVSPKKSILVAALDKKIDMPFSCQSGLCSACKGKLVQGEVKMEEDEGLTEEEIKAGYILCCVSHPKTDNVKIVID